MLKGVFGVVWSLLLKKDCILTVHMKDYQALLWPGFVLVVLF